ncbi:MAG: DNA primase [Tannerellaceae bacterium]|nr:DNA primase [Tannerellaceae bacterium]
MIDQPTIDRILDAANIVDVVSEFVTLRRRGVNYVGLCPFHTDKSPSFYVSPAKNICKCFACGEGGTSVHFIMKHEQVNYFDALRFLAKKYHIDIQERELTDKEKQIQNDRESMLIVNSWAQSYFTTQLYEHVEGKSIGLRYFSERGFREDIIRKFQLGYSLDQRDALYKEAIKKGYKKEYLEKTGLIVSYENGNVNDRFRGRVIFPVHGLSGKVVAFGGRTLKKDDKTAKYVNSPESPVYHKSNELYGIFFAKQAIVKADKCFLVEGYTDVISMHQAGIENVVASSGTALTQQQIRLIHRFTNQVTVLYDGDAAGIKAALRGIDLILEEGMNVKVVLLPDGEDPDSFARKNNATGFTEFIKENETDFIRFKTRLLLDEAGSDPIKRSSLISDIIKTVAIIPDNIARSVYIRECSTMMEIEERVLLNEVNKIRLKEGERQTAPPSPVIQNPVENIPTDILPGHTVSPDDTVTEKPKRSPFEPYELTLLKYIVKYGSKDLYKKKDPVTEEEVILQYVAEYVKTELEQDDLTLFTPLYKQMLEECVSHCREEGFTSQRYFLAHPDPLVSRLAAHLISEKYQLSKYHSKFRELDKEEDMLKQLLVKELYAFKNAYIQHQIKDIQNKIKQAQNENDPDKIMELMIQLSQLDKIKRVLSKELGERIIIN